MKEIKTVSLFAFVGSKMREYREFYRSTRIADHPLQPDKPTPPLLETPKITSTNHTRTINQRHTAGRRRF